MQIIVTSDGSHSVYSPQFDEAYHSSFGALQESVYIFISHGLLYANKESAQVLEIGFGTGLNAFLTAIYGKQMAISYTGIERYPLSIEEANQLNYGTFFPEQKSAFSAIHQAEWGSLQRINDNFQIQKLKADALMVDLGKEQFDVVYFDAFSPEKHPDMWTESFFTRIFEACKPGAVLTTYCSKGYVRRLLQGVGFTVERLPGPKGKRQILRAIK
jgi:tRNA U34 5-methylaminomethyl-2-thiouridine-forming methyltransferase MnmC